MSVQVFLQGKILGIEEFLLSSAAAEASELQLAGRSHWIALLSEILPRALLSELGLARILLGSSGGGQFLIVLPLEAREQAESFLSVAAAHMKELSGAQVSLVWASTENLGDWSVVRKRLNEAMLRKRGTPAARSGADLFEPRPAGASPAAEDYLAGLATLMPDAPGAGWSPEKPGMALLGEGRHTWSFGDEDAIRFARHIALVEDVHTPASATELGARAHGAPLFGVLRGDVDNFGIRLRRAESIQEHLQLSQMYRQFFAGELGVLCSMPDYWRNVTILYAGGDDFAVYGAWDALIPLARELQRLFHRLSEENLKDFPGPEGKTITMALAVAERADATLASVYDEAGQKLEAAKSSAKDSFSLLGRTLEWKQVGDAAEIKDSLVRMVSEFGASPQFLPELAGFYREPVAAPVGEQPARRGRGSHFERPWRIHRRLSRVASVTREREFQKVRSNLITELIGKGTQVKLRPAGRVALEWARLATEV